MIKTPVICCNIHQLRKIIVVVSCLVLGVCQASARELRIVGSSTVYPFTTAVAERMVLSREYDAPIVEPTGTGAGLKRFCSGVGPQHADIAAASRAIKASELELCASNGVDTLSELNIGYDGIVFVHSKRAPGFSISREQFFLAVTRYVPINGELVHNPYERWSDISPDLPDTEIEIVGPPASSGTRDFLISSVTAAGAARHPYFAALRDSNPGAFEAATYTFRDDGRWLEIGEDDAAMTFFVTRNETAVGVIGYSSLARNMDRLAALEIEGVSPSAQSIASGEYALTRPLYLYWKPDHLGMVEGMYEYLIEMLSEQATGPNGYLVERGLVAASAEKRQKLRRSLELAVKSARQKLVLPKTP